MHDILVCFLKDNKTLTKVKGTENNNYTKSKNVFTKNNHELEREKIIARLSF